MSLDLPGGTMYTETDGFIELCVMLNKEPAAANPIAVFLSQSFGTGVGEACKSMAMIPH